MATSGILVKNAAVSLVNGVYNKYSDDNNGRRWLSSDNLCLVHFTKETIKKGIEILGTSNVPAEMVAGDRRYYKYDKRTGEYFPIQLVSPSSQSVDDQLGNTEKHLVADSLDDPPRALTLSEIALGDNLERIYCRCDISSSDNKAPDVYIGAEELRTAMTIETRTKEIENVYGNVTVKVEFLNLVNGDSAYIKINNGSSVPATNGIAETTAEYGATVTAYIRHTDSSENVESSSTVQYVLDRVASYRIDTNDDDPQLENQNSSDRETYTAALYYIEPVYTLCEEIDMNHWSISQVKLEETGLVFKGDLYYAFTETSETSPYDGLPWILIGDNNASLDSNLKVEYWDESSVQANTTTTTDPDGAIRTTTTFVNIITGETYTDTQVVREKHVTVKHDVKRYDYINLAVGKIYRFRFVSEFSKLGWIPGDISQPIDAGVYKVDKIMSYYDSVIGRIDLFVNLYEPCGVSKAIFDDDKKRFADTTIYRLVSPNDSSRVYFVPNIFIEGQPDASVMKYNKLLLMVDLGIQPNSNTVDELRYNERSTSHPAVAALDRLDGMADLLKKILQREYGLVPTDTNPLIKFSVYGHTWLTDDGFRSIENDRSTNIIKAEHDPAFDYNTLFKCEESNKWYLENKELRARVENLNMLIQQILAKRTGN